MNKSLNVIVIDDHPAMAYGTKMILEELPGVRVSGIAGSGEKGLQLAESEQPDIIFLDFNLPDMSGSEAAVKLKERAPHAHIVVFTGIEVEPMLNSLLQLEVSGILSKDASEEQIKNVIRCVLEGQTAIPIALFHQMYYKKGDPGILSELTNEEEHIMSLIVKGATNEQIADDIHMSKRSVDNYVRKIYDKFGVNSRTQAVERFLQSRK